MFPLPLNFLVAWKNNRRLIKFRLQENDKSYRLENFINYAQNKSPHGNCINFFSSFLKFLKLFFFQFAVSKFYLKFDVSRTRDKKSGNRTFWKLHQLFLGHIPTRIWYQTYLKLPIFWDFIFFSKWLTPHFSRNLHAFSTRAIAQSCDPQLLCILQSYVRLARE